MKSALKRSLSRKDRKKSQPQAMVCGVKNGTCRIQTENSNPTSTLVAFTAAEHGLAQHSGTCANAKRQLGCVCLVLETLIIWTWHNSASGLPDLGANLLLKGQSKSQDAAHPCRGAAVLRYSGHLLFHWAVHLDCTLVWVRGASGLFGRGNEALVHRTVILGEVPSHIDCIAPLQQQWKRSDVAWLH